MRSSDSVSTADLQRILDLVDDGKTDPGCDLMPRSVLHGLMRLIGADWCAFSELDLVERRHMYYIDDEPQLDLPPELEKAELDEYFAHRHEHPACQIIERGPAHPPPVAVSDVVTLAELRRRRIYAERFVRLGSLDELCVPLPTGPGRTRVFILGRSTYGFTGREHLICRLLQPHLLDLYQERKAGLAPIPAVTPRERDVLECVAEGLSDAEIAKRLSISAGTVRKHLDNVFSRFEVSTRTAAVAHALRAGIDR